MQLGSRFSVSLLFHFYALCLLCRLFVSQSKFFATCSPWFGDSLSADLSIASLASITMITCNVPVECPLKYFIYTEHTIVELYLKNTIFSAANATQTFANAVQTLHEHYANVTQTCHNRHVNITVTSHYVIINEASYGVVSCVGQRNCSNSLNNEVGLPQKV